MALTKIQILNMALTEINSLRIESLTGTEKNETCNDVYNSCLELIMQEWDWKFARKREELTLSTTEPAFEYAYAYVLPSDFVRIAGIYENVLTDDYTITVGTSELTVVKQAEYSYVIEGNLLLTNINPCYLVYTSTGAGKEALFKPRFTQALIKLLAAELAPRVSAGSLELSASKMKEYMFFLQKAKQSDGVLGKPDKEDAEDSWLS
jgi:hypothetical protein